MKRSSVAAVALIGFSALVAGCGSSAVSTTPASAPSTSANPANGATSSQATSSSSQKAAVGSTIDLSDSTNGDNIAVTVVKVVDPDGSTNEFETPTAGGRFESIQFRIVNTGTGSYQDDPLVEISAKDASGQTMQEAIVTATTAGAQMPSSVTLTPGDTALGFVTFDVPSGDKIAQAQYSLDLGIAATTGQWQIGSSQTQSSANPPQSSGPSAPSSPAAAGSPPATSTGSSAQQVVEDYFAAINAGNYALAWSLGGMNIENGSYSSFVQGFADTSSDTVTVVSVNGDTVSVTLDAAQTDGTHKYFAGTYTVRNGVIVAADIQ